MMGNSKFNTIVSDRQTSKGSDGIAKSEGEFDSHGQINWSKLLVEELNEIMKKKDEELIAAKKKSAKEK